MDWPRSKFFQLVDQIIDLAEEREETLEYRIEEIKEDM